MNGLSVLFGGIRYFRVSRMKDGVREGFGRVYRPDGTLSYVGNFSDSMRDGSGLYMKSNGTSYEGEFYKECMKEVIFTNL
jgi:hypothetical protein